MANKTSGYSMLNVAAVLDGVAVTGFWDGDDAVVVAPVSDVGTMVIGADGPGIFSQSADKSATITLRLQHTSAAHRVLMQKLQRQRSGYLVPFPFSLMDSGSGEGGSTDQAFISQAPDDSKGKNAVVREWVLVTADWEPGIPNG